MNNRQHNLAKRTAPLRPGFFRPGSYQPHLEAWEPLDPGPSAAVTAASKSLANAARGQKINIDEDGAVAGGQDAEKGKTNDNDNDSNDDGDDGDGKSDLNIKPAAAEPRVQKDTQTTTNKSSGCNYSKEVRQAETNVAAAFDRILSLADHLEYESEWLYEKCFELEDSTPATYLEPDEDKLGTQEFRCMCSTEFTVTLRRIGTHRRIPRNDFDFFENEEYATHPWHGHAQEIRFLSEHLDGRYKEVWTFISKSFDFKGMVGMLGPRGWLQSRAELDWTQKNIFARESWPIAGFAWECFDTAHLKVRNPLADPVKYELTSDQEDLRDKMRRLQQEEGRADGDLAKVKERRLKIIIDFAKEEYSNRRTAAIEAILDWAATLSTVADDLRKMICPLQGTYFSKAWAVGIAMRYSNPIKRGDAVKEMIANKRIPATSTRLLRELIKKKNRGIFFIDDEWKPVGKNPRKKGCLILAVVPIKMMKRRADDERIDVLRVPQVTSALYMPPKAICVDDYFWEKRKDVRLYFSPRQFRNNGSDDYGAAFEDIKRYVIQQTRKNGELSYVGNPEKRGRFSCKTIGCKFHFIVKCDSYGYYLHQYDYEQRRVVGYLYHNHK